MKIAVVILAGGKGRRIGGNKPLRMLGGKSLLDRALDYANGLAELSAVAVRDAAQVTSAKIPIIRDDEAIDGPLAGLVSALRFAHAAGADAALTIPADMPFLPADLADRFVKTLPRDGAAIASSGGHLHAVCGLWSIGTIDFVTEYLASGRRSLRGFAETVGYAAVEWPAGSVDPFFNINSEEDLAEAEKRLEPRQ